MLNFSTLFLYLSQNSLRKLTIFVQSAKKFSIFWVHTLCTKGGQDQSEAGVSPLALINSAMMLTPISSGVSEWISRPIGA